MTGPEIDDALSDRLSEIVGGGVKVRPGFALESEGRPFLVYARTSTSKTGAIGGKQRSGRVEFDLTAVCDTLHAGKALAGLIDAAAEATPYWVANGYQLSAFVGDARDAVDPPNDGTMIPKNSFSFSVTVCARKLNG